ncbi:MAG: helix-turn-helix domain-containing protein [Actinomycetota bacterium]|jgi:excisionase family DNA binding protein|nr:helix-turn-helix domain-containing protein [Actinomycetota bacterium]
MSVADSTDLHSTRRSRFLSVAEQASELGVSEVTLYRAIKSGEFPAVRIRGRLLIPAGAVEAMVDAALAGGTSVDASNWVVVERGSEK